ncbi:hypothetical protein ABL78_3413 [Leptomonas seymouri]|uniref:Uncharacterized protein n=1 Tax=Leptomonas seymouri TaxID=5684 RepID=A0A0N1I674_LEPSE|nr:hypothetical protein ABL78_3413 [Leptomonas seymouri]|eukprot:KPI87502.1 hypothetical protein ABL78_3413 [Leptomonas seymouri]
MPGTVSKAPAASAAITQSSHRRRETSATVPATVARLAHDFRPTSTQNTFTKRFDGFYNEPYSPIVEHGDEVSVLCVQYTLDHRVLVRYMPEREWRRIVHRSVGMYLGQEGRSSLHVLLPRDMSTLPRSFHLKSNSTSTTHSSMSNCRVTALQPSATPSSVRAAAVEPAVFDYFVAAKSRVETMYMSRNWMARTFALQTGYTRMELQRVAREDCRAALAVERRRIFLCQYQRDMQSRIAGVSLYTVGKEVPQCLLQTFFMLVENAQAMRRYQERVDANNPNSPTQPRRGERTLGTANNTTGAAGGRYLFTLDQACTTFGERLPFAGQASAEGFVVVTVGPVPDVFSPVWPPWRVTRRTSETDGGDDGSAVPYAYGSAVYLPRPATQRVVQEETDRVKSPPLSVLLPYRQASKNVSGLSSNGGVSSLGPSRSPSLSPSCFNRAGGMRQGGDVHTRADRGDERTNEARTPSQQGLPPFSEGDDDNSGDAILVPAQVISPGCLAPLGALQN